MKFLYIDAFSGVSGDKFVAALLSLDKSNLFYLKSELSKLGLDDEYSIELVSKKISSIECSHFLVNEIHHHHHHHHLDDESYSHIQNYDDIYHTSNEHTHEHDDTEHIHEHNHNHYDNHSDSRNYREIKDIILNSSITKKAKSITIGIFDIIAKAEAIAHNVNIDDVHFHEIGAIDSIVDIASCAILIDKLDIDIVESSHIPLGNGFVRTDHGILPVPAPATAKILEGVPTLRTTIDKELTTPTGAAIVKYLVNNFSDDFNMNIEKIGYGAGTYELSIPNFLRLFYGEKVSEKKYNLDYEHIVKLETNLDDITSEELQFLIELLMENGSLEVYVTPVHSKKGRSSFLLNVLSKIDDEERLTELIYLNSTTLGIRRELIERTVLKRDIRVIQIDGIDIKIKSAFLKDKKIRDKIEYEDVKRIAKALSISYSEAYDMIMKKL